MAEQVPTVLCVDDDPAVLEVLAESLAAEGFNVITATNGVEAFLQVWRRRPRAVVLDLFMPRLGGLDALDSIRRLDAGIVIILISGVEGVLEMIREAGVRVAGVFPKPVNLAQLTQGLARAGVIAVRKPAAAPEERPPSRRRVLVVDDEPEARDVLREYFKKKGFDTLAVASGEEGLAEMPNFRPDVVLLDIAMPRMTGVEALERIKALPQETCVVMVSGKGDEETARRTLALGAADYIRKPVDFAYLDSVLEIHFLMSQVGPDLK